MKRNSLGMSGVAGLVASCVSVAVASAPPPHENRLSELLACRAITADAARLACFDAAGAKLANAEEKNDIVIVDREQIRETKRNLFGLSLPNLAIFGDKDEPLAELDAVLVSAQSAGDGATTFVLDNGSRWNQEDDVTIGYRMKAGAKVVVRRGALGAYRLSVDGHPGVRVQRIN